MNLISSNDWNDFFSFLDTQNLRFTVQERESLEKGLESYCHLLLRKNEDVNLTAISDPATALWKHFADSLTIEQFEPLGHVLDWGSGGGLPGIPLLLSRRARGNSAPVTFLDSVGKKITAIREFLDALDLSAATVNERGEVFFKKGGSQEVDSVVMRAVAPPERAIHWLSKRAARRWVFMLTPKQLVEWKGYKGMIQQKGLIFGREHFYELPKNIGSRVLLELIRSST